MDASDSVPAGCHVTRRDWRLRIVRILALLALMVVASSVADAAAGVLYRTSTSTTLHVTWHGNGLPARVLVVFPGHGMPGEWLSSAFAPLLPSDTSMIVVQYAERGVEMTQIYHKIMVEIYSLAPSEIVVYGASMGGMCGREFLARYAHDGQPYGRVVLVLDSAPSSRSEVRLPGWVFRLASWYRGGPLSTAISAGIRAMSPRLTPETDANVEVIAEGRHAGEWVGLPALTSQAAFIAAFPGLGDGELNAVVKRATYLRGHGPGRDPVVDTDKSINGWRRALPGLTVVTLMGRDARWHLPLLERPRETMEAVLGA